MNFIDLTTPWQENSLHDKLLKSAIGKLVSIVPCTFWLRTGMAYKSSTAAANYYGLIESPLDFRTFVNFGFEL